MNASLHQSRSNESGRTALDMLRTLLQTAGVVILVLIALIGGYRQLMYYNRASGTVDELSKRAVLHSGQLISGAQLSDGEFGRMTKQGYAAIAQIIDNSFFEISLLGVPGPVCRRIIKTTWKIPSSIYVNAVLADGNPDVCKTDTFNRMSFEFSRELQSHISNDEKPRNQHCRTHDDCEVGCQACRNGLCISACAEGEQCAKTIAGENVCCAQKNLVGNICCAFVDEGECCFDRNKCCPMQTPFLQKDGSCSDCFTTKLLSFGSPASLKACQAICPNRTDFGADGKCMLPVCGDAMMTDKNGDCQSCDVVGGVITSRTECAKCPNRRYEKGLCLLPCAGDTVVTRDGLCQSCANPQGFVPNNAADCDLVCPNRHMQGDLCVLKTCPEGFTVDDKGNCMDCTALGTFLSVSQDNCSRCPNRQYSAWQGCFPICPDGTFRGRDGICRSCDDIAAVNVFGAKDECLKCPGRILLEDFCFAPCGINRFRDVNGICRSCQDMNSYRVTNSTMCSICPNRRVVLTHEQGQNLIYCAPQQCPHNFFSDRKGGCYDCYSEPNKIDGIPATSCAQCENRIFAPLRETCLIPDECRRGEILDSDGHCHDCNADTEIILVNGRQDVCDSCPNRYLFGYWCRRCPSDLRALKDKAACQKCGGEWDNRTTRCMVPQ